jgi:DNA polymerase-3 subunit delta'
LKFSDITGHARLKESLIAQVKSNRVSHAQLFAGAEGSNALPLALAFAQYINCSDKHEKDSCGVCPSCHKYKNLVHPDLHLSFPFIYYDKTHELADEYIEQFRKAFKDNPALNLSDWLEYMETSTKKPNINVKEIRNIIKKLSLKPYEAEYKVMIIWLPEFLGNEGNVLLKIIEEPPAKTLFLMVSENPQMLLSTIVSRTQLVKIPNYSRQEIEDYLIANQLSDAENARNIALIAAGNINKAVKLSGEVNESLITQVKHFFNICYKNDSAGIYQFVDKFKDKDAIRNFLLYTLEILRLSNSSDIPKESNPNNVEEEKLALTLSKLLDLESRLKVYRSINQAFYEIDRNGNVFLILINISLTLRNNFRKATKAVSNK